jgi:4-aminobutyrate aminotransferase-like enzyme
MEERYPFIGHVQGKGLAIGVELVKDRVTKEPLDKSVCVRMFQEGLRRGLVSMVYSPHFRVNPALSIDEATAEAGLAILDEVFGLVAREGSWR